MLKEDVVLPIAFGVTSLEFSLTWGRVRLKRLPILTAGQLEAGATKDGFRSERVALFASCEANA
jgi:hypothetical protein